MNRPSRRTGLKGLRQAFDEVRFGAQRTLNLRESLPTPEDAAARTEAWLRQRQVDRAEEVLIITGRGNQSEGGVSLVRDAVVRLLHVLKRRGVITGHQEHTPGSFVVTPAPLSALWESPRRSVMLPVAKIDFARRFARRSTRMSERLTVCPARLIHPHIRKLRAN
jgi:hypothetical protein